MQIIRVALPADHEIDWFACTHFGNTHQHLEGLKEMIAAVSARYRRHVFVVGDIAEAIQPLDKRYEKQVHQNTVLDQYLDAVEAFRPIRNRLIGAVSGNHDGKLRNIGDMVAGVFCKQLKIPYGTTSCKIHVTYPDGKLMYKVFVTHPHSGSIRSTHSDPIMREAGEKVQLKRKLTRERMADCILNVAAHFHKAIVVEPHNSLYLVDDGEKIKQRYVAEADQRAEYIDEDLRWYASVPGWLKKYILGIDGYVERAGLDPMPLGIIRSTVQGGKIVALEKVLV